VVAAAAAAVVVVVVVLVALGVVAVVCLRGSLVSDEALVVPLPCSERLPRAECRSWGISSRP